MSGQSAYFRSKASEAEQKAGKVVGPERTKLLEVARNWTKIAEIAETLENPSVSQQ